jgi:hypothetical protein
VHFTTENQDLKHNARFYSGYIFRKKGAKMEKQNRFNAEKLVIKAALALLSGIICVALASCGKKMARIEQNQLEMQYLIRLNTQLINDNMKRIKDNHNQLHVSIEDVQRGTKKQSDDVIAAIGQEHAALRDILQMHQQRLNNSVIGIERSQGTLHGGMEGLNANISRVDESTSGLKKDFMEMQQNLQNNNKELTNLMEVIGQRQIRSEERIQENIQMIVGTLKDVHQNQARLQEQIVALQGKNQETNSKIIAALEQMKVTLSQMREQISQLPPMKNVSSPAEIEKEVRQ